MTVSECIEFHKTDKVSKLWICPEIVNQGSLGNNYVYTGSIDRRPPEDLTVKQVKKRWTEDNTLCIIYYTDGNPIIFT